MRSLALLVIGVVALVAHPQVGEHAGSESMAEEARVDPSLVELRKAAASAFFGSRAYDETSRLTIAELLPEHTFEAGCTGAEGVYDTVLKAFQRSGFEEVDVRVKYPGSALYLVRRLGKATPIDILLFYFKVERAPGLNCRYTLGQYARAEDEVHQKVIEGSERDRLFRDIKETVTGVENTIRSGKARRMP